MLRTQRSVCYRLGSSSDRSRRSTWPVWSRRPANSEWPGVPARVDRQRSAV